MRNNILKRSCWTFFCLLLPIAVFAQQPPRSALVIGNGAYKSSPLQNPPNDAKAISEVLAKCNFAVTCVINGDRSTIRRAIRNFGEELNKKHGVGLFYYAGHGIQVDGINYLVPVGAKVFAQDEIEDECLKVSAVLRKMETAGNKMNIIILDACRDNPFAGKYRSTTRGLARMDAPAGSILAYATAPGSTAMDGETGNGLYTKQLLKHVLTPGVEIGRLFRKIRKDVITISSQKQIPWESSSLTEDFFFVPPNKSAQPAEAVQTLPDSIQTAAVAPRQNSPPKVIKQIIVSAPPPQSLTYSQTSTEIADIRMPTSISVNGSTLILNGAGIRTKWMLNVYAAGLFLKERMQNPEAVKTADAPMIIRLHMTSDLVTPEKMKQYMREGFSNSVQGNIAPFMSKLDQLTAFLGYSFDKHMTFDFVYLPSSGLSVYINGALRGTISGIEFKKGFFGIWLSENAVDDDLKIGLLGQ